MTHLETPPESGGNTHNKRYSNMTPSLVLVDWREGVLQEKTAVKKKKKYPVDVLVLCWLLTCKATEVQKSGEQERGWSAFYVYVCERESEGVQ